MDKDWMELPRASIAYRTGVESFLKLAFKNMDESTAEILCPCKECVHGRYQTRNLVRGHLVADGFVNGYKKWIYHGEDDQVSSSQDTHEDSGADCMPEMVEDIFNNQGLDMGDCTAKYHKYMLDASQPLFNGSDDTILSFMVWLFSHKCNNRWSDVSVDGLLTKLKSLFPFIANIPNSFYELKKMVGDLGFSYEKIDVCPNDCVLYWRENSGLNACPTCKKSRWKTQSVTVEDVGDEQTTRSSKVAAKQLRYMPLIPRLQRLFALEETAEHMVWYHKKRRKDGVNRHPADSEAWKHVDRLNPSFAAEIRNVRLGLSTDGMSPFTHGAPHTIWPVTVVIYNLPPWKCMKQQYFITPLLIPGPNSPGNNIDVYLRPLIEELKTLWSIGVETHDVSTNTRFTLRAILMWTVSDFPALAMLKGYMTKGYLACPSCQENTRSIRVHGKECYIGHRCFLDANHPYRADTRKFDGKTDFSEAPVVPTGFDEFEKVKDIKVTFGNTKESQKTVPRHREHNWRKCSIFFELPYWKTLLIRHNLDVMHIEKNVCDSLIGTLLGMQGKTKDTYKSRLDLVDMGIRKELHPRPVMSGSGSEQFELPATCYTLSKEEKQRFLQVLKNVKVPDGYASNISRCVNVKACKISGLKSHDCHILMQQLLPIALRATDLPYDVCSSIIELCNFFRELCSNENSVEDFERLSKKIPLIVTNLEAIFLPAFFDIMIHLPVHLAEEARVAGNVRFRDLWSFERNNFNLKGYIRNRSHPEGSIAEGIISQECMAYCSKYLKSFNATWNQRRRNDDGQAQGSSKLSVFRQGGRFLGTPSCDVLSGKERDIAHSYVLYNCPEVQKYISMWQDIYKLQFRGRKQKQMQREIDNAFKKDFPLWLRDNIKYQDDVSEEVKALAFGPNSVINRGSGYLINGYRFHTESLSMNRRTQNCGVWVVATTRGYSSAKDQNPREEEIEYFGILENVIELDYYGSGKVVLFKCKWYDTLSRGRGVKSDAYGFTLVNSKRFTAKEDPFVMPTQVKQIFYVDDGRDKDWRVVIKTKPRDLYENVESDYDDELGRQSKDCDVDLGDIRIEDMSCSRKDVDAEIVSLNTTRPSKKTQRAVNKRGKRRRIEYLEEEDDDDDNDDEEGQAELEEDDEGQQAGLEEDDEVLEEEDEEEQEE